MRPAAARLVSKWQAAPPLVTWRQERTPVGWPEAMQRPQDGQVVDRQESDAACGHVPRIGRV